MATNGKQNKQEQEQAFAFLPENVRKAEEIIARYPAGRQQSAVMPLLMLAQRQNGNYLTKSAMDTIASILGMAPVRVYEVASFYTMYNLSPVGRHVIEVCTTTPCWLSGSDAIMAACEKKLGIKAGETTADGNFTLREVECLGACVNAPMCAVGDHFYEDLTAETMSKLIDMLALDQEPKPGPQSGRHSSEPRRDKAGAN
jgi:NADH-quinone oxidoreductase E subunit